MGIRALTQTMVVTVLVAGCSATARNEGEVGGDVSAASTTLAVDTNAGSLPVVTDFGSTLPPEPTGVPGVDDEDGFCAAWARYSGTLQALGVASAFGGSSSADIARLELIAAPALADAVAGIDSAWPADLEAERSLVVADLIGPYGRRAGKAIDALVAAGATADDLAALRAAWLDALRTRNGDQPVIDVVLADGVAAIVDRAAATFDAAVTPFADDPSLVTESVDTPATDVYLAEHCPDLASSGYGDAI